MSMARKHTQEGRGFKSDLSEMLFLTMENIDNKRPRSSS